MSLRTIRLKEHKPSLESSREPTERILERSDSSMPLGPYRLRTDSQGFILTGNDADDTAPDLFIIGDSFVESMFADEDLRFASQLERSLADTTQPHRVRNGGYSGMTTLHMLGVLTTKVPMLLKPGSKLLLVIGQSDANALLVPGLYWEQTRTLTPFTEATNDASEMQEHWRDAFVRMVTTVITFAKLQGYDFAITAGLFRHGDFDHDEVLQRTFESRKAYDNAVEKHLFIIDELRTIARDHGVPLFDASEQFLERPDQFYDLLHLNHAGQTAYASALSSWIVGNWAPCEGWRRRTWWRRRRVASLRATSL
jgi:lysophospholipase L1-like esterase